MPKLLMACLLVLAVPGAALAAAGANIPNPPLNVAASQHDNWAYSQGDAKALVFAMSATDMPVPYVNVYIKTCAGEGQQTGFNVLPARPLDANFESLKLSKDGRTLTWTMFSAPANTDMPARLPLDFAVPKLASGAKFCVRVWGFTREGTKPTGVTTLRWRIK